MTIYTVTPESTKQPGTWTSQTVPVTGEEGTTAILWLRGDGLADEPYTTTLEWRIEKSDDGQNWEPIIKERTMVKVKKTVTFPEQKSRYLRLYVEKVWAYAGPITLYEFEVYKD